MTQQKTTDFGYQQVPVEEKAQKVAQVFSSVASKYDIMNDVMSFGIHRLWKRFAVDLANPRPGERILDLAGGTGDLTALMSEKIGETGSIVLSDINPDMLEQGRIKLIDQGIIDHIEFAEANAEDLPFPDRSFNLVTIAFGLRNVTNKEAALNEIYRVLKPGGRVLILEFSKPILPGLRPLYDLYSFTALPLMGKLVANDSESYRYLAESIRMHPDQKTLQRLMEEAGFEHVQYYNLTGGIVAIHRGYKF